MTCGCKPAGEAAPGSTSVTHLLALGAAHPQDATGPRVPFQATFAFLPFFSFGASACGHRRGTWMLWVLTPLGAATLLCPHCRCGAPVLPPAGTRSLSSALVLSACCGEPAPLLDPLSAATGGEVTGTASTSPGTPCAGDKGTPALSLANQHVAAECNANSPRPSPRAGACPLPRCQNLQMPAFARGETERVSLPDGVGSPEAAATQRSPRHRPPPPRTGAQPPAGPLGASGQQSHPARHRRGPTWGPAALPPPY